MRVYCRLRLEAEKPAALEVGGKKDESKWNSSKLKAESSKGKTETFLTI
jgi:hypothetical protein